MDVLLISVIAVFAVCMIIALVFIVKLLKKQNNSSEIHISGGANIDRGYLSNDNNYFKGGYSGLDETVVIGTDHRVAVPVIGAIRITNLGTMQVYTLNISSPVIIGRIYSQGGLALGGDVSVSKQHCRLYMYQGAVFIEDMGSSNGTYVNSNKLRAPYRLSASDVIKVGNTKLRIDF